MLMFTFGLMIFHTEETYSFIFSMWSKLCCRACKFEMKWIKRKVKMLTTKLYINFLWILSISLFSTMFYTTRVYQHQWTRRVSLEIRAQGNCSCKDVVDLTALMPVYNFTRHLNSTNETKSWQLTWPEKNGLKMCKSSTKYLVGRIDFTSSLTLADVRNVEVISNVKYGGVYRPSQCRSSEKVAVIIPYRDRAEQLDILVHHLHSMLQRQQLHYGIYVVEMALPVQFNRGLLANAGFLTAKSIGNYTCYIIHDVDLIPMNDYNLYKCNRMGPTHLVSHSSAFETGKLPYNSYVGGVIALSAENYDQINGFSNLYFGWGGEDDDVYRRMTALNMSLQRPPKHIGLYLALPHSQDSSNPPNPHREMLINQAVYRIKYDGVSSLNYNRKAIEFRQLFTWILIDCVETEVLERYPFLRADSALMAKKLKQSKYLTVIKSKDGIRKTHNVVHVYRGRNKGLK